MGVPPTSRAGRLQWDWGVRDALHQAAEAEGCDFPGLGPHSFRRANITWRQQVGGSAIEASKIAGHSDLEMTGEYTFVAAERQNELTRRTQEKLAEVVSKVAEGFGYAVAHRTRHAGRPSQFGERAARDDNYTVAAETLACLQYIMD